MKRTMPRLRLRRETLARLETVYPLNVGGGVSVDTTQPGNCCATHTSPPLNLSGACESDTVRCDTNRCA